MEHTMVYAFGVHESEDPCLNLFTGCVTLGKPITLPGCHMWNRNHRSVLRVKWIDCRNSKMHIVGSTYMAVSSQMEAFCFGFSGESQQPGIRMLELDKRWGHPCLQTGKGLCFHYKWYTSSSALRYKTEGVRCMT
jgi:hypothetical protein